MHKTTITCPKCKAEQHLSWMMAKRIIHCSACNEKIYIDTKLWFVLIAFLIFMFPCFALMALFNNFLPMIPSVVSVVVTIVFLYVGMSIVQYIFIKVFGVYRIFTIHNDDYYKQDNYERTIRDREQKK